jgi:hypothetical protein
MPWQERYELRTSTFGCNCSTTTFLAAIITFVSTLAALVLLWGLFTVLKWLVLAWISSRGGWVVEPDVDGQRVEYIWVRKGRRWKTFWQQTWARMRGNPIAEEDEVLIT